MVALALGAVLVLAVGLVALRSRDSSTTVPAPAPPPIGRWQTLPDLTSLRGGTTAVLLGDGRVLAVGGGIGAIPLAGTEILDPATLRWTRSGDLQQARRGNATVVLADGRVLVAGGVAGSRVLTSVEVFDAAKGTWTPAAPMHDARFDHVLITLGDGRVLAAGGTAVDGTTALRSAEIYDPRADAWTMVASGMVEGRTGARAVLLGNGRVVVAGGASSGGPTATTLDSSELFDPAGLVFTRGGSLRQARSDLALALLSDGRVLATGGSDGTESLATAEILDPAVGVWSSTGSMAHARRLHRATVLPSGQVLVTGGEQVQGGARSSLDSAEIYDPATGKWQPAATMACPRSEQAQVALHSGKVLVLGGDAALPGEPPRAQSCTELFDPSRT